MRLFVAIELSSVVKEEIGRIQSELKSLGFGDLSYSNPAQSHLTLKFLGDVPQDSLRDIIEALETAAKDAQPFRMLLDNVGWFPPNGTPRVIWVAVSEDDSAGQLAALARSCEDGFEALGCAREDRQFSPHITVARVKQALVSKRLTSVLKEIKAVPVETFVTHLSLFESKLQSSGAVHSLIHQVQL